MRRPSFLAGALVLAAALAVTAWPSGRDGQPSDGPPEARAQDAEPLTPAQIDELPPARAAATLHRQADRGPEQPIPFSHRFHVSELQIQCEYCHTGTRDLAVATMPPVGTCMGCHRTVGRGIEGIDSLRAYSERGEPIPWERVYKVPEFVQFTHRAHLRNEIECQECHGPVEEMDRIYKATSLGMGWCLSCHRDDPRPGDVATDVRLARDADVPETPAGRQDVGLYPRRISQGYGTSRAPDDCATCHY